MYAYLDGDNVGFTLNRFLNLGRAKEATQLSESITQSIFEIAEYLKKQEHITLILAGGDDILFSYKRYIDVKIHLKKIKDIFSKFTGLSMSHGVGENVQNAIDSLAEAKKTQSMIDDSLIKNQDSFKKSRIPQDLSANLYIFVGSHLPDPYINVIAHCLAYHSSINSISFIDITHDRGKIQHQKNKMTELKEKIKDHLELLCNKTYYKKSFTGERQEIKLDLSVEDIDRYRNVLKQEIQTKVVLYTELEANIEQWKNLHSDQAHIFDVTAALKSELIDIYTICRYRRISTIYSFELLSDNRTYDHKELIHALHHTKTYLYKCLAETTYTTNKIIVDDGLIIDQQKLNNLQNQNTALLATNSLIIKSTAKQFTKIIAWIYALFLLLVFLGIGYYIYKQPNAWDNLEPTAFIIGGIIYSFNFLFQLVFDGSLAEAANPFNVFKQINSWYENKIKIQYDSNQDI